MARVHALGAQAARGAPRTVLTDRAEALGRALSHRDRDAVADEGGWSGRLRLGAKSAIGWGGVWIGASGRRMHTSSWAVSTHERKNDRALGGSLCRPDCRPAQTEEIIYDAQPG
jgi:hypothetical protein